VPAEYLVRLDDACPTMDSGRWEGVLGMLASHSVKPIIAVVPANADPDLCLRPAEPDFWQDARSWAQAGCVIALHGYSHELRPSSGGLVPVNRFSEFVGLPINEQRRRIRDGVRILNENGLDPNAWVAPAHGFDSVTLQALKAESRIRIICDGFMRRAVHREDFTWLPQQLWRPREMKKGLWTICIHPNAMDEHGLRQLKEFIAARRKSFPDPRDIVKRAGPYGLTDAAFSAVFQAAVWVRQFGRKSGQGKK